MEKSGGVHDGHRARMRARFKASGGNAFAEHELFEMLLYYSLPRRDTNELAHKLMEEFGSLSGVLEAESDALARLFEGKENSVFLLQLVGELTRRYTAEKLMPKGSAPVFDTPEKIAAYMVPRYVGVKVERAYMLLFDNGMRLLDCIHIGDGSVSGVMLSVRMIAERAYQKRAAAVVLTHNHPDGLAIPSGEDIRVTRQLEEALRLLEIPLVEHFIFTSDAYVPILCRYYHEPEENYAASSLVEVLKKRLHKI